MEEPPKVERLLSSRGISLSNAASILKSYVSIIDQHHGPVVDPSSSSSSSANNGGQDDTLKSQQQQQQDIAAEEKEEERLLARLNQLDPTINNTNNRLGGSISEDVYERLRMIMESVVAESEGRVVSAVGVYAKSKKVDDGSNNNNNEEGGEGMMMEGEMENNGQDEFMKELEEAERLETEYNNQEVEGQQQPKIEEEEPQQQQKIDYEQKKKDKKAKKAAKKAKKEAKKRKASSGGDNEEKRVKVEEDQE